MSEALALPASLQKAEKLHEEQTAEGCYTIYQSPTFGRLITHNQQVVVSEQDGFFYHEMMAHPIIFTHHHPQKIAVIGHDTGVAAQVLKHVAVKELTLVAPPSCLNELLTQYLPQFQAADDNRITRHTGDLTSWINQTPDESFDIIIVTQPGLASGYQRLLRENGLFVQPYQASWLYQEDWLATNQAMQQAGAGEWHLFHFPQPSYATGWRFAIMATKSGHFKRVREKDIFNRNFATRYYNLDVHKASLALPEFIRHVLVPDIN